MQKSFPQFVHNLLFFFFSCCFLYNLEGRASRDCYSLTVNVTKCCYFKMQNLLTVSEEHRCCCDAVFLYSGLCPPSVDIGVAIGNDFMNEEGLQ